MKHYTTQKKFNKSMTQGQRGELIIATFLDTKGYKIITLNKSKSVSDLRKWDIKAELNKEIFLFEVKTDMWEYYNNKTTDNMFLEYKCGGKPSGIEATDADYYIYYYPHLEKAYIMEVGPLKDWLLTKKEYITSGGDSNAAWGYLIKRDMVERKPFTIIAENISFGLWI